MANRHGGARPGAGRKKAGTVDGQRARRDVVLDVFDPEELRACLVVLRDRIKAGQVERLYPLLPYLLGSAKQEHDVTLAGAVQIYLPARKPTPPDAPERP